MTNTTKELMILIAGPYRSGTHDNPDLVAENLEAMNRAALKVFRAGHIPVVGEWFALPLLKTAVSQKNDDEIWQKIFDQVAMAVATRCDACLRIGGPSKGADMMVGLARSRGQQIFYRLEDVAGYA